MWDELFLFREIIIIKSSPVLVTGFKISSSPGSPILIFQTFEDFMLDIKLWDSVISTQWPE